MEPDGQARQVPEPDSAAAIDPEERERKQAEEAAEFITSQVLDKGANFFEG